jgi:penicillin V acylase-like amidase (Ntn superfamily)
MMLARPLKIVLLVILAACVWTDSSSCTLFSAAMNNSVLVGRNLDWTYDDGRIWIHPPDGKRFGVILFEQYGEDLPFEGMNSEGLFVGENAVPDTKTPFFCGKPWVRSLRLIGLLLERCATVEDALQLIPNYIVIFGTVLGYPLVHYMIADKSGNSAVVEYYENELRIIRKNRNDTHQLMTNFYIVNPDPEKIKINSIQGGYNRFAIAKKQLHTMTGINVTLFRTILEACHNDVYPTIWSNVYDLKSFEIHTFFRRDFNTCRTFKLQDEFKKGRHSYTMSHIFR